MASGHSQGGISILARTRSIARRENGLFSREVCKRRKEWQQCTFAVDLYATFSAACAVDASVRPRAPRSPTSPRRAPRQPCRRSLSNPALVPPIPAGGASTAVPVGGAGGGAPVDTLAGTGAPAPTPHAALAGMRRDVANAGMNSVANVNMCLKIVGVTSLSQLCLHKKEVVSVRLLHSGFTATDLDEAYMAFKGEKDTYSPAADNSPAAALTDDQLERQRLIYELDTRYKRKLGEFRSRITSTLNAARRVSQDTKAYTWAPGLSAPVLESVAPDGNVNVTRLAPFVRVPTYTCNDTCIALSGRVQRHL
jgi:hypothetical protein